MKSPPKLEVRLALEHKELKEAIKTLADNGKFPQARLLNGLKADGTLDVYVRNAAKTLDAFLTSSTPTVVTEQTVMLAKQKRAIEALCHSEVAGINMKSLQYIATVKAVAGQSVRKAAAVVVKLMNSADVDKLLDKTVGIEVNGGTVNVMAVGEDGGKLALKVCDNRLVNATKFRMIDLLGGDLYAFRCEGNAKKYVTVSASNAQVNANHLLASSDLLFEKANQFKVEERGKGSVLCAMVNENLVRINADRLLVADGDTNDVLGESALFTFA